MNKTINVGLIGFGVAGKVFHAPILTAVPGFELKKIRETKADNIAFAEVHYPDATIVASSEEIFSDPEIDLVVIATPNTSHATLVKQALKADKHVVVDKPFTVTSEEADALIELANQQNKILSVYHNRRYDSNSRTVKKLIDSRILGNLVEFEAHYDRFRNYFRPGAWREEDLPGSGIFYDLGAHVIDEVLCLFGLPKEIRGDIRIQRPGGKTIDSFDVVLDYETLKVTLKGGMLVREPGPTYSILGDQGAFIKYGMDVQEAALRAGKRPGDDPAWGEEPENIWGKVTTDINGLTFSGKIKSERGDYRDYYANVYKAILGEEELAVSPQQARNTIRVIELAIQSSQEKRTLKYKAGA